jgi:hypothetical protein
VREGDAEHLCAGVGVGIEVDQADRPAGRAGLDVGLRDRVVAPEDDRKRTRLDHLGHRFFDRLMRACGISGSDRRIAEVDHLEGLERVDARLEMRAGRAARSPDRSRPVARSRPIGDEVVGGSSHDGDVDAGELGRILGVRLAAVGEETRVVGLFAVLSPAV